MQNQQIEFSEIPDIRATLLGECITSLTSEIQKLRNYCTPRPSTLSHHLTTMHSRLNTRLNKAKSLESTCQTALNALTSLKDGVATANEFQSLQNFAELSPKIQELLEGVIAPAMIPHPA